MKILVAGGTGNLGSRIIHELRKRGADIRVVIRPNTALSKIARLKQYDVGIFQTDMTNINEMTLACKEVDCVVSALQGLHDVIVDVQSILLNAAVNAGVHRFIPSDFAADFTKQSPGENRNFDLRREFHERLDKAPIAATSILNGAFAELLSTHTPLLDMENNSVGYWEDPDWRLDFTTMDNTAAYTAAAALDTAAPRILRIAGFQVSPQELATVATTIKKEAFKLTRMGSLAELAAQNKQDRATHPEGENELYPSWQQGQYMQSMFSVQLSPLDNHRYPEVEWTDVAKFISSL